VIPAGSGEECEPRTGEEPVLSLEQGVWMIDGVSTPDAVAVTRYLLERRRIWEMVAPPKPSPSIIVAAIPVDTALGAVRPMLVAARAAGYSEVDMLEAVPVEPWRSRTLGDVPYHLRACRVRLGADWEVSAARTWGGLASVMAPR